MTTRPLPIGFHFGSNATAAGYGDYVRALDAAGIPAVLMSVGGEGFGDIAARWDNGSTVNHVAVIRCLSHNDVPLYGADINTAVNDWLAHYVPTIGGDVKKHHQRVITKHGNELDKNHIAWLANFYTALHPALLTRMGWTSHRIACFSFASGEPEPEQWETILPFIELAGNNPDKFVFSLHEYSYDISNIWARDGYLVGRFKKLYDICDAHGIKRPLVVSHEWGWEENEIPSTEQAMSDIDEVAALYASYPTCLGAGIWTLQKWHDTNYLSNKVQKLIEPVKQLALSKRYEVNEETDMTPKDCDLYLDLGRFVHLLPQDTTGDEIAAIAQNFNAERNSFVYSHDDAELVIAHGRGQNPDGKKVSEVKIWEPQRFTFDVTGYFASKGYKYSVGYFSGQPPAQWTTLPIPHLSQYGPGADKRSNDCGAAAAAMVIRGMTGNAPTVDDIAIAYQSTPNAYMNFTHIDNALNGYGMDGTRQQPYTPEQISATIASGKPVIALVWYQSLPRKFSSFNGSHFIAIYGTDKNGRMLYRDPLAPSGFSEELVITYAQLNTAMAAVTAEGNQPNQAMDCVKKNEAGQTVDMLQYFKPPSGSYGQVTIKDTNWGQGQVRQQIQAHGDYLYVTKGVEFEARRLTNDRIFLVMDDSPGDGKYYVVQSQDGWIPRYFTEGQSFTRQEEARFYYKSNCSATGEVSTLTNVIKFVKFYASWQTPGGLTFNNVSHLQWILNGVIEEDYYLAPGVSYALWKNRHGRQSHIVEMPQGQGNNVFRGACYWPAFGKEWP